MCRGEMVRKIARRPYSRRIWPGASSDDSTLRICSEITELEQVTYANLEHGCKPLKTLHGR